MRRSGRQTLLGSLRGAGTLKAEGASAEVDYALDRFEDRQGQRASGSVTGDVSAFASLPEGADATLVLQNGSEISVVVSNAAADGADVEALGAVVDQ